MKKPWYKSDWEGYQKWMEDHPEHWVGHLFVRVEGQEEPVMVFGKDARLTPEMRRVIDDDLKPLGPPFFDDDDD